MACNMFTHRYPNGREMFWSVSCRTRNDWYAFFYTNRKVGEKLDLFVDGQPSHEAVIKAAQEYLAKQDADIVTAQRANVAESQSPGPNS